MKLQEHTFNFEKFSLQKLKIESSKGSIPHLYLSIKLNDLGSNEKNFDVKKSDSEGCSKTIEKAFSWAHKKYDLKEDEKLCQSCIGSIKMIKGLKTWMQVFENHNKSIWEEMDTTLLDLKELVFNIQNLKIEIKRLTTSKEALNSSLNDEKKKTIELLE